MPEPAPPAIAPTVETAYARVTAPGAPFETTTEVVHGEAITVFRNRPPHLRAVLEASVDRFGDRECWVFDTGRRVTFREHADDVARLAHVLRERYGVDHGDRVGIWGANSYEWILTFWACASLGAIATAYNGWWQADELRYAVELTEPKLLIADEKRLARLDGEPVAMPSRDGETVAMPLLVVERDVWPLLDSIPTTVPLPDVDLDEDDAAAILFTSGTTGRPKGAVSTHRNFISFVQVSTCSAAARAIVNAAKAPAAAAPAPTAPPPQNVSVTAAPMFHVSGLQAAIISTIANGSKTVWTTGRFDPKQVLDLVVRERAHRFGGITTQMWRIVEHPDFDTYDLSHVTSCGGGGSVWSPELQRTLAAKMPKAFVNFSVGYGLTECAGLCTSAHAEMMALHPDAVGKAVPTAEVCILDDDGLPLPDGEVGHVCIRGPMVTPGYWRNDKATADAFFPGRWLNSGDYGRIEDGYLFLATRRRDLIIRGGENIYPIEIENRLDEHPAIAEAAVVAVDHRELGQQVKAVVVPRPDAELSIDEVRDWVAATLAYYKVPEHVDIRHEPLPRNATGKVMKHVLTGEAENTFVED